MRRSCLELLVRSRLESVRRLWAIWPSVWGPGIPRRPRLALLVFGSPRVEIAIDSSSGLILLDSNENKVRHAEREFGEACTRVDVARSPLKLGTRIRLFFCLFMPGRLGTVIACLVLTRNLWQILPRGSRVALYNPYFLVHYAAAEFFEVEKVFHLAANYPRVQRARNVFACAATHEILGYPIEQQRLTLQPHKIAEDVPVVRVYLSQIVGLVTYREEAALIDFARWVGNQAEVQVEIFLHYLDRDIDEADPRVRSLFENFGTSVRRDDSLNSLSARQVSFSATSTIGYDLLSSDICHVVVFDQDRQENFVPVNDRMESWRARRADVISFDTPYVGWLEAAYQGDKKSFEAVFGCLPGEVVSPR